MTKATQYERSVQSVCDQMAMGRESSLRTESMRCAVSTERRNGSRIHFSGTAMRDVPLNGASHRAVFPGKRSCSAAALPDGLVFHKSRALNRSLDPRQQQGNKIASER